MKTPISIWMVFPVGVLLCPALQGQSTIDPARKYFHGANIGWMNARPATPSGALVREYSLSGFLYAANIGWISLGNGLPANGYNYTNTTSGDYGVNIQPDGSLKGFAYSANVGWISFDWADADDEQGPKLSLINGSFSGFAWSANCGWLNLESADLSTLTISRPDNDGDGISDQWEFRHFASLTRADALSDSDKDGQSDLREYLADTLPRDQASRFEILSKTYSGKDLETLQVVFTSQLSRQYFIQSSSDLGLTTPWITVLQNSPPDSTESTSRLVTVPSGASQFIRVGCVLPLSQ